MEPAGASKEKLPSISVTAPIVEPFTITFTPKRGSPFESFTTPLIKDDCKTPFSITEPSAFTI